MERLAGQWVCSLGAGGVAGPFGRPLLSLGLGDTVVLGHRMMLPAGLSSVGNGFVPSNMRNGLFGLDRRPGGAMGLFARCEWI